MYTHRVNGGAQSQNLFTITFFKDLYFIYVYIYVHVAVGAHADQKRALDFQELELQVFMIDLTWVLKLN